jgi:hypothetical protein
MDLTPYPILVGQVVKASSGHFPLPVLDKRIKNWSKNRGKQLNVKICKFANVQMEFGNEMIR